MPDEITIEQVDLESDDHVAEAIELIARFAEELGAPLDWPTKVALPSLFLRRKVNIFLARREGEAVGVIVCQRTIVTFRGAEALNIHDLFVDESARRCGVGKRLMEHTIAIARSLGCVRVTLEVDTINQQARHFYQALGFELPEDGAKELHYIRLPLD
jgi:ribosomal protein S18 acetylase RimI-like enzyme